MALTPTSRYTGSAAATTLTSSSFTPSDNSLLVAMSVNQPVDSVTWGPTISGGSLTWTKRAQGGTATGGFRIGAVIWTAPVTTGASMTVTVGPADGFGGQDYAVSVVDFTGYDVASPIGVTGDDEAESSRSGAYSLSLSGTSASTSYVIGAGGADGGPATAGTGWTNVYSTTVAGYMAAAHQYRSGALSTADWDAITTSFAWAAAAIEIKADGGGGGTVVGDGLTSGLKLNRLSFVRGSSRHGLVMSDRRLLIPDRKRAA